LADFTREVVQENPRLLQSECAAPLAAMAIGKKTEAVYQTPEEMVISPEQARTRPHPS
jgi:hypothetical protein